MEVESMPQQRSAAARSSQNDTDRTERGSDTLVSGEGVDDKIPGAFMWREGMQVAGEKCLNIYFDVSQVIFVISDS
jgi:hypothetical protein